MRGSSRGFTLIEILVVVIIIAIVASLMLLSVNVLGRDTQIAGESQRLLRLIGMVREQAEMQSRDVGLTFYPDGYEFLRHDVRRGIWLAPASDPLMRPRKFPAGVAPRLTLEGREVLLKPRPLPEDKKEPEKKKPEEEDMAPDPQLEAKKDHSKDPPPPQVFIFASGDMTPFELVLERAGSDHSATLTGKMNGEVDLRSVDEAPK